MGRVLNRHINLDMDSPLGCVHFRGWEGRPDVLDLSIYTRGAGKTYRGILFSDITATASRSADDTWQLNHTRIGRSYNFPAKPLTNKERQLIRNALLEIVNQWWISLDLNELERLELEGKCQNLSKQIELYRHAMNEYKKELKKAKEQMKKLPPQAKKEDGASNSALSELLQGPRQQAHVPPPKAIV